MPDCPTEELLTVDSDEFDSVFGKSATATVIIPSSVFVYTNIDKTLLFTRV